VSGCSRGRRVAGGRRRILLFLVAAVVWTLLACYPNPVVLVRNLARYRHLPIDAEVERKMRWDLPSRAASLEFFVDSLLVPAPDWKTYRVPWYVPTALEAARTSHGDCESKTILLASLLEGKRLPYEIRASFTHIWVDYAGRRARPGETRELAYLEGEQGRLRLRRPGEVPWREVMAAQREQLWDAMPPARKALWLLGLLWIGLGAALLSGSTPEGDHTSQWRPRWRDYFWRAAGFAALVLAFTSVVSMSLHHYGRLWWTVAGLREAVAMAVTAGAFLAWLTMLRSPRAVTVTDGGSRLIVRSSLGLWRKERAVESAEITHLELIPSAAGYRPGTISAALRTGERVRLLHYRQELPARAALRSLGLSLSRPLLVRGDGAETRTMSDEIPLSLRARAARRPQAHETPRPRGCMVAVEESNGLWVIRMPPPERRAGLGLLGFAAAPVMFLALATLGVGRFPMLLVSWVVWMVATALVGLVTYLAIMLRGEIVAYLAGVRVEIGEGMLRYYTSEGKTETLQLDHIETTELARCGETATIAVVSPDRVLHIRGLGMPEHREWLRQTIQQVIVNAG